MAIDPELLKLLTGMQGSRPRSLTPNSLLGGQGESGAPMGQSPQSPSPVPDQSNPWMTGLGIGSTAMQTAAPVAGMLLNRQRPQPHAPSPVSVGSRPVFQPQSPYGRPQDPRQSMLIRQLLGR